MNCLLHDANSAEKSPNTLTIQQTAIPKPNEDEVLIRVQASSVNRLDLLQAMGKYPVPPGVTQIGGLDCQGYVVDPVSLDPVDVLEDGSPRPVMALLSGGAYG